MSIKTRSVALILGLQALAVLSVAAWGEFSAANQARTEQRARAENELAFHAQRVEDEGERLARAAGDLALIGSLLHQQRDAVPSATWHEMVRARLLERLESLPEAIGGGWWFEPGRVEDGRRHYGPYVHRDGEGLTFTWDLSSPEYDYHSQPWYLAALPRDWPRDRRRPRSVYWSEPYLDEAGTSSLMLTAGAPMHDATGHVIGIATVDWSLSTMGELVAGLASPAGRQSFLIDRRSGRFLVFSPDPSQVMQSVELQPWAQVLRATIPGGAPRALGEVDLAGIRHLLTVQSTSVGLLLGTLEPTRSGWSAALDGLPRGLLWAALWALPFMALAWLVLARQFRPMEAVLESIGSSLSRDGTGRLMLAPVVQASRNEFSPLVDRLNAIYEEINRDAERLAALNQQLQSRQQDISSLNSSLERRINERTFELESKNAELQRTVTALSRLQGQMVEAEKQGSLSRLVAGIAHDINTPLGIAVTAASHVQDLYRDRREALARASRQEPELRRLLEDGDEGLGMLLSNLQRAAALVRSFKQISVDQSGEGRRRFDLAGYLEDVLLSLRPQHKRLPHSVGMDCPRGIELDSFPGAWAQIVTNLVMNALLHALKPEVPGRIEVIGRADGEAVELRVKDDGVGIPAERQARIFDAFFTTGAQQGGSGLGLAVVRDLVQQRLGGRIEVHSQPGRGSEFIIHAPRSSPGNGHEG